jgi:hypothetical protein
MYVKLYRHCDEFVVIDDVDGLYTDRSGVRLLICGCQSHSKWLRSRVGSARTGNEVR